MRFILLNDSSPVADYQSFLQGALTQIEPGITKKKYPLLGYRNLIYVDTSHAAFANFIARRVKDYRGGGKWSATGDNTAPTVDVSYDGMGVPVYQRELAVRWNTFELQQASVSFHSGGGLNLKGDKMEAVQDIFELEKNLLALYGSTSKNMEGLLNSDAVDVLNATMSIRNLVELISFDNGIQFVINYFLEHKMKISITDTNTIYVPKYIILDAEDYGWLQSAVLPLTGDSIMSKIEKAVGVTFLSEIGLKPGIFTPRPEFGLDFKPLTKKRMVVGCLRDKSVSRFILPMDLAWGRPFPESDQDFKQIGRMRTAGTEILVPKAVNYVDLPAYDPAMSAKLMTSGLAGFNKAGKAVDKNGKIISEIKLRLKTVENDVATLKQAGNPDAFVPADEQE